jgi:hypothetical protein
VNAMTPRKADGSTRTIRYLGAAGVAAWFGVEPGTVTKWLSRYEGWPVPDCELAPGRNGVADHGWLPEREQEWREWKAGLPGQGAKGKPKPRRAAEG